MEEKTMSAFEVRLPAGTQQPARVEWRLTGPAPSDVGLQNAGLARGLVAGISSDVDNPIIGGRVFYGEVTNTSATAYGRGFICAAWIDAQGRVIRVATGTTGTARLDAGGRAAFTIFQDVPASAVAVRMYPDALVYTEGPAPDIDLLATSTFSNRTEVAVQTSSGTVFGGELGEVRNTTGQTRVINVYAEARGANGQLIAVSGGSVCDVAVPANGTAFADYIFTAPGASMPNATIRVEALAAPNRSPIDVSAVSVDDSGGLAVVEGTVRNTSGKTLDVVRVCAAVYSSSGNVIGVFPASPDVGQNGLAPNATAQFETEVPIFGDAASAEAIADGFDRP
jgi:hypothetical protein